MMQKKKLWSVHLEKRQLDFLRKKSKETGETRAENVRRALDAYMKSEEEKKTLAEQDHE